jgi:predicted DNA-binding transcriptional regulator AlpA
MTEVLARPAVAGYEARTEERLLDVRQLAAYLGLDDSRLWLMRLLQASLRGPHSVRVAGHSYWWRSDVDAWLRRNDLGAVLRRLGEDLITGAGQVSS